MTDVYSSVYTLQLLQPTPWGRVPGSPPNPMFYVTVTVRGGGCIGEPRGFVLPTLANQ